MAIKQAQVCQLFLDPLHERMLTAPQVHSMTMTPAVNDLLSMADLPPCLLSHCAPCIMAASQHH